LPCWHSKVSNDLRVPSLTAFKSLDKISSFTIFNHLDEYIAECYISQPFG